MLSQNICYIYNKMTRTYIKDGKHKSIKNNRIYKELKTKLDFTPKLYLDQGKREDLKKSYKYFLKLLSLIWYTFLCVGLPMA